jgi:hypothetical protein
VKISLKRKDLATGRAIARERAFVTIQPLLAPDPAPAEKMLELISNAQNSLYMQLQYIHPSNRDDEKAFTDSSTPVPRVQRLETMSVSI